MWLLKGHSKNLVPPSLNKDMETYLKNPIQIKASAIPKYPKKYAAQGNYVLVFLVLFRQIDDMDFKYESLNY